MSHFIYILPMLGLIITSTKCKYLHGVMDSNITSLNTSLKILFFLHRGSHLRILIFIMEITLHGYRNIISESDPWDCLFYHFLLILWFLSFLASFFFFNDLLIWKTGKGLESNTPTKMEEPTIEIEPGLLWSIAVSTAVNTLLKDLINLIVNQGLIGQ